jgi:hypothetical protein
MILMSGIVARRLPTKSSVMIVFAILSYLIILIVSVFFLGDLALDLTLNRIYWGLVAASSIVILSNLHGPRNFLLVFRGIVIFSAILVILEFILGPALPLKMSIVPGRAAGLFQNPNNAAIFLSAALPVATIGLKLTYRSVWYALIMTSVFVTFSRGGLAMCGAAILLVELFPAHGRSHFSLFRRIQIVIIICTIVFFYAPFSSFVMESFPSLFDANAANRVRFGGNYSSDLRFNALRLAWEGFSSSPLWGLGTGAGDRWSLAASVHNMFALTALEYGIIGLVWLVGFLMTLWAIPKPFGIWLVGVFTSAGMFSHNLFDGPTYAVILATYAALPAILRPISRSRGAAARSQTRLPSR